MAGALAIPLGISFEKFDRHIQQVADKIENVGKTASLKFGQTLGDITSGKLKGDELSGQIASIGSKLASGMADGTRKAGGLMLGLVARIEKQMNKFSGVSIAAFKRIDSHIRLPAFDNALKRAQIRVGNLAIHTGKKLSSLDIAKKGGFGSSIKALATLFDDLFLRLEDKIGKIGGKAEEEAKKTGSKFKEALGKAMAGFGIGAKETLLNLGDFGVRVFAAMNDAVLMGSFKLPESKRQRGSPKAAEAVEKVGVKADADTKGLGSKVRGALKGLGKFVISLPVRIPAAIGATLLTGFNAGRKLRSVLQSIGSVGNASFSSLYERHGIFVGSVLAGTKVVWGLSKRIANLASLGAFGALGKSVSNFRARVAESGGVVSHLGKSVGSVGGKIAAAFGVVGVGFGLVQFFRKSISWASALNETVSRSKIVFGTAFDAVDAQAAKLQRAFGVSRKAQLDLASGYASMAQGAGFSEKASASLSNQMVKMAADLSSSVNIPFEQAGEKIRSALAGQSEPLRQFGANVSDAAVKEYALSHGLAAAGGAMSEQAKITARAALIMEGLNYAQGDLERTSGSAANQFRKAGGGIQEFATRMGTLALPVINLGVQAFNNLLEIGLNVFEGLQPKITAWVGVVSGALEKVGMVTRNLGAVWKIAQLRIGEFAINAVRWVKVLPENFGPITEWIGRNWWNMLVDLGNAAKTAFTNLVTNAKEFGKALWNAFETGELNFTWTPLLEGFKATTEKLPELIKPDLINVDAEVAKIWKGIEAKEAARAKAIAEAGKAAGAAMKPPGALTSETTQKNEYKLAGAAEIGSQEAYSAISRNYSRARSTTSTGKEQVGLLRQIAAINQQQLEETKRKKSGVEVQVL